MKKARPTLQDIADKVGVTKMTVSRYLRDPEKVSEQVGKKIALAVEELGYIPNRAPDLLSNAKSYSIGVLVPSLGNQVFEDVIKGIESVIEPQGYQAMLTHYGYSKTAEEKRIETLLSYHVDGIILSESLHTERATRMLQAAGIPIVEIMDSTLTPIQQAVGFNNYRASLDMTNTMIKSGKKHIVYLAAKMDERAKQKIQGYSDAMKKAGIEPVILSSKQASSFTTGACLLQEVINQHPDTDGIFCTNDVLAAGALFECTRQQISVPDNMAIAGFHGNDITSVMSPKLATVITPRKEIGRIAAEQLMNRITNPKEAIQNQIIELKTEIYRGESL
ncbi:substrate-binding domain-containing protein [Vibrio sp. JC009]|uniref:substrate-binding domain-containing protein n=1 Tax=Vibrio sp. JC009 TaxID=2912314 RepID=UPI0023AE9E83|nr:substrate-binding domain-containing protein [Vibrio sp. JC009]WED21855.1 substrate-binding domain-containing protein [Vibrio sp. JC009]